MKANELMRGNWVFIDHCSGRLEESKKED